MNIEKLELLVDSLKANHSGRMVDMGSDYKPSCGTPGCHAGELYLALQAIGAYHTDHYHYLKAGSVAAGYLEVGSRYYDLERWAMNNPEIWGYKNGKQMFYSGTAFGQDSNNFPSQVIVDQWDGVLKRAKAAQMESDND